jgi:putative nucleotidyltransferase with HDIG domain
MDGLRIGRTLNIHKVRKVVDDIVDSILNNANALTWLTKIKNKDEYTAEHSLNVCILSVAFARHLGLPEEQLRKIGLCGLLHDVGKAKIPDEILNKPGRFTDEEMDMMKLHTVFGRDLLLSVKDVDHATVDVAYMHHERIDERGYPRGLKAHQIPYYAKLISVVDTYDAITSARVYDAGRSSMEALDIIYKNRNRQFDEHLALEFIKFIGIYPPGSIVQMTNGEVGIVLASNKSNKLRPRILMVLDKDKKPVPQFVIDLSDTPKDLQGEPYMISGELPNGKFGVDIREFLKRGLVLKR